MFRQIYACMILAMAVESAIEHGQDAADSGAKKPIRQRLGRLAQSKKKTSFGRPKLWASKMEKCLV